ncbi:MAG TPA: integrase core domain-containing protein [Herpetosiphonaceae bacterium]|nr:integrase core domain-containing protein [Herpetosiphonaceae bacterium]
MTAVATTAAFPPNAHLPDRDNAAKYGQHFAAVAVGSGIAVLRTPIKAPRANAIYEPLLGSVRRECLDHLLVVSEAHRRRVLNEYVRYFNCAQLHQGIGQPIPEPQESSASGERGTVIVFPVLGGLYTDYRRAALPTCTS